MEYQVVKQAPKTLEANELVINKPTFLEEIGKSKLRRGVSKLTTANALRDALMLITDKYDQSINPYRLNLNAYEGLAYETDEDLSNIIVKLLAANNVDLVTKAVDFEIKARNKGVNTVYYVSDDLTGTSAFLDNGFSLKGAKKDKNTAKNQELVV